MTTQEVNRQLANVAKRKNMTAARARLDSISPTIRMSEAVRSLKDRVASARTLAATFSKEIAKLRGLGIARLQVEVSRLSEKLAVLDVQVAALAKQVDKFP